MTEVPEHLLRRSRERREALGLAPGSAEGAAPATEAAAAGVTPAEASPAPAAPAQAEPTADAAAEAAPTAPEEEATVPAGAGVNRTKIPVWVMPVLVVLPFWGVLYVGAFGDRTVRTVVTPQQVYAKGGCSSCHGAQGEGGTGPPLSGGASKLTFPNEEDHVNWVKTGSGPFTGRSYGNPNRPGGPRPPATGGMPGFEGQLTEAEIRMVVQYERDQL